MVTGFSADFLLRDGTQLVLTPTCHLGWGTDSVLGTD